MDCKSLELVVAGWCTVKSLKLDQTLRNLICGDLKIFLVGILTVSNWVEKGWVGVSPGLAWGKREEGWFNLV